MSTQPLWLFDLDNTLHDAAHAVFPAIHVNMTTFIADMLGSSAPNSMAQAEALRIEYWQRYGATLIGMIRHHQIKPANFLQAAHRFDDLASMLRAERGLLRLLRRLPGRKILLTNAPARYANEVLRHLRLQRGFDRQIAIESMHVHRILRPKPSSAMLRKLLARERISAARCILVEDTLANLKSAKRLGMRTVWVTGYLRQTQARSHWRNAAAVDVRIKSVLRLATRLRALRIDD